MPQKKRSTKNALSIFLKYITPYRKQLIVLSLLGVVSAITNALIPFIVGGFLDAILDTTRVLTLFSYTAPLWVWFLVGFGIVQITANFVDWRSGIGNFRLTDTIDGSYPSDAIERVLQLPISFHKTEKAGEIWFRINQARIAISVIVGDVIVDSAPQILSIIVGFIIAFIINPTLALIILGAIASYIVVLAWVLRSVPDLLKSGRKAWGKAYGYSHDALGNVSTIKHSSAEEYESTKIRKQFLLKAVPIWFGYRKIWYDSYFYQRFIIVFTQILIFSLSVYFIRRGELTVGGLIAFNGYSAMVLGPFARLGGSWQRIQESLLNLQKADEMLSLEIESYEVEGDIDVGGLSGGIEFRNVSFSYERKDGPVLRGVNLRINPGEVVALVGESGVGKTTLVELISGYYFANNGKVLIDGYDIRDIGLKKVRGSIAVVPQEVVLFNDTIKMNIKYGSFRASDAEMKRAAKEAHADVFINKFPKKYKQIVGERGIKLSVGQKQRVAIARAILRDPKILILDEPTSALDAQAEKYITESLDKLMQGRTTIIIAHRLSTVRRADKIFVFEKGKIVEQGKHSELIKIKNGVYQKLYNLHIGLD